jgi:hypothetical protein
MIAARASGPQDRCEAKPQGNRAERKTAEYKKHRAVTNLLAIAGAAIGSPSQPHHTLKSLA